MLHSIDELVEESGTNIIPSFIAFKKSMSLEDASSTGLIILDDGAAVLCYVLFSLLQELQR
ncbi:hypothetical protein NP945_17820 [Mesorhizobium sp. LMG17149]|uniref:hypothetical protein n=1 Tax=Mesorhizobium sp. LMG17149 TaxID=2968497 RepID=UPI0021179597|nr:hypothetical protein [Mesorhizobium sp. LMG17149]MCQ8873696.1 hypothetical protein [Mesorhizobium sp. LMG17149]